MPVRFEFYKELIEENLLKHGRSWDALESLAVTTNRYGWNNDLYVFGKERILPSLSDDAIGWGGHLQNKYELILDKLRER